MIPPEPNIYDVIVWLDSDHDTLCCAFTPDGEGFMSNLFDDYSKGDVCMVKIPPTDFLLKVPNDVRVGFYNLETGLFFRPTPNPLH